MNKILSIYIILKIFRFDQMRIYFHKIDICTYIRWWLFRLINRISTSIFLPFFNIGLFEYSMRDVHQLGSTKSGKRIQKKERFNKTSRKFFHAEISYMISFEMYNYFSPSFEIDFLRFSFFRNNKKKFYNFKVSLDWVCYSLFFYIRNVPEIQNYPLIFFLNFY